MSETRDNQSRPRLKTALRWTLAAVLIGLMVAHIAEHRGEYSTAVAALGWRDLIILVVLQVASLAVQSWRSQVIVERLMQQPLHFHGWFRLFLISRMLNTFMSQAGSLYRAYSSKKIYSLPYTKFVASSVVFIWIDTILNVALVCVLLAWITFVTPEATTSEMPSLLLATLFLVALLLAAPIGTALTRYMLKFGSFLEKPRRWLHDSINSFWMSVRDPGMIVRFVGLGLVSLALLMAVFLLTFADLGVQIAAWQAAAIIVLFKLTLVINITPGNIGVREWAIVGAAALFGIDATVAMTVALVTRVTSLLALLVVGLPAALMRPPQGVFTSGRPSLDRSLGDNDYVAGETSERAETDQRSEDTTNCDRELGIGERRPRHLEGGSRQSATRQPSRRATPTA